MKFSQLFKKNVCVALIISFVVQVFGTCSYAASTIPLPTTSAQSSASNGYMSIKEGGLDILVMEFVRKAASMDTQAITPSPALQRCYKRIVDGHKTIAVDDVMQAMPELLNYAINKYEYTVTRSSRPCNLTSWEAEVFKAPRPQNPYAPGAVVGSVAYGLDEGTHQPDVSQELCEIANLLLIIKNHIGTVNDPVCCNTVLGVLGDACNILGMSISEALLEILESLSSSCCAEILNTLTTCCQTNQDNFEITWSRIEECCQATHASIDACCQETHTMLVEILNTLTQCCDDLADDIFDTQEIIIECCQLTQSNFQTTWSVIRQVEHDIEICCEQTNSNFEYTWSLIENLQVTATVDLSQVFTAIDDCCLATRQAIEQCCQETQSAINNLSLTCSLVADLTPVLDVIDTLQNTLTDCCAQSDANFAFTWSLIAGATTEITQDINDSTSLLLERLDTLTVTAVVDLSPVLIALDVVESTLTTCCAQSDANFETTWSLINNLDFNCSLTIALEPVLDGLVTIQNTLTTCCQQNQTNFETTWSLFENINVTCSSVTDLTPVLSAIDEVQSTLTNCCAQNNENFLTTWSLINEVTHIIAQDISSSTSIILERLETLTVTAIVDISPVLDALGMIENTVTTCCAQSDANFVTTWSLINNLDFNCSLTAVFDLAPVLTALDSVESTLTTCCAQSDANFVTTWSLINNLDFNCSLTAVVDLAPVLTALDSVESTLTTCCAQSDANFITTWSLINNLDFNCSLTAVVDLAPVLNALGTVESTLTTCCAQNDANFVTTWSLIRTASTALATDIAQSTAALGFVTDHIVSFSCTETDINNLDVSAISLLKTLLNKVCSLAPTWVQTVEERGLSLDNFTQTTGVWAIGDNEIQTTAELGVFNFLRYNVPFDQSFEVLQVDITFPVEQPESSFISAGLVSNWNGLNPVEGSSVAYITFDNAATPGTPINPRLAIQTHNVSNGLVVFNLPEIVLGTTYTLRLVKSLKQTSAYLNGVLIGQSPDSGTLAGDYIGMWAFSSTAYFTNFKSWSALAPLPL